MRLTAFADYSLRVLVYVGLKGEGMATVGEIADAYGISRNHLTKVVNDLAAAGWLDTVRGRGGGMRLAMAPSGIRLGDVVRRTEPDFEIVPCFGEGEARCRIDRACVLRSVLDEALEAFLGVLDRHTLEDLLKPRSRLARLLLEAT